VEGSGAQPPHQLPAGASAAADRGISRRRLPDVRRTVAEAAAAATAAAWAGAADQEQRGRKTAAEATAAEGLAGGLGREQQGRTTAATAAAWVVAAGQNQHGHTAAVGAACGVGSRAGGAGDQEQLAGLVSMRSAAGADDVDFADDEVLQGRVCCPAHFCQSCHMSGDAIKLVRCWLCPRAYHTG
jgi:hypothetical protein